MPQIDYYAAGTPTLASILLDAEADRVAHVFTAPKAGGIRKIGWLLGTVSIAAPLTLTYSLQTVDPATGMPDDTDDETAIIANANIVANTMVLSGNLSADRTVTKGEIVAMVVKFTSGTFTAADQVNIQRLSGGTQVGPFGSGYIANNLTGAYAKVNNVMAVGEIEYSDGSRDYMPATYPWNALATDVYNNGSTPDEIGLRFQVAFPCRLAGIWAAIDADGDLNVNVYTASSKTVVASRDKDVRPSSNAIPTAYMFGAPVVLAANTTYIVAIEPSTATSLTLYNATVRATNAWNQTCGGQAWHYATAKNPATTADFTFTETRRPLMGLILDQVDDGASAGGGVIGGPNKRGGKQ